MTETNTQAPVNVRERLTAEEIAAKELADANAKVQAAKERLALIENLRLQQLQIQQAERLAAEQRRINEERERHAEAERRIRERREKEERERREADTKKRQEEADLQRQIAEAETATEKRKKHEADLKRIADEQFRIEQAAAQAEADLYRQNSPALTDDITISSVTRNENLAMTEESKDANRDTQGRARLFSRTLTGFTPDYNVSQATDFVSQPQSQAAPAKPSPKYVIAEGKMSDAAFAELIAGSQFPFFVSPATGELCAGMVRWQVSDVVGREWTAQCLCTIEQTAEGGYVMRRVKGLGVLTVVPTSFDPLFQVPAEAPKEVSAPIDQDEKLLVKQGGPHA